jgi:outer membrane protein TolC
VGLSIASPLFGKSSSGSVQISSKRNGASLEDSDSLKANLLDNLGYEQGIRSKKLALDNARKVEAKYQIDLKTQIEGQLTQLQLANQEIALQKELISLLERRLKVLETRVNIGEAKRVDLVDDIISLQSKKTELIGAVLGYLKAAAELEVFVGVPIDSLGMVKILDKK